MNKKLHIGIKILFLILLAAATCQAATFTVTNKNNSGAGSLRQAIINAGDGDKIIFAAGLNGSIFLTSPLLLDKNLIINGPGANVLGVEGRSSPTESRVFTMFTSTMRISDLRIANGFTSGAGGAINVESGGSLTLNNCLIIGNVGESAGGVFAGSGSTVTITNSTITGNVSFVEGGGISNRGGTLTLINSTINDNEAPLGGGVSVDNGGTATILNSTITENGNAGGSSGEVGGLRIIAGSTVNLKNTIVARNNVLGTSIADVGGTVSSQGTNLIGNSMGGGGFMMIGSNADLLNMNPQLGALANNGGTTQTQALLAGSPAINAGNNTGAPATDQRGVARPQGAAVDIGSYESGVSVPTFGKIVYESTQDGNREIYSMNADFTNQIRLTNNSAEDSAPKWSPDGTKIVFQSRRDGNAEIYTMNADGSVLTRLTSNTPPDTLPDWSPDGSKIVFVKGSSYPSEIWTMDTTGGNQTQISGNTLFGETEPAWSPDGSRIAFSASPTNGGTFELYAMNADGTNRNRLTTNTTTDSYPVWSPDGNSIAYLNDFNGRHAYLINPFNLNIRIVADINDPNETAPAWSPDGTKLAQYDAAGILYFTDIGGSARFASLAPEGISVSPLSDWFGQNTPTGANVSAVSGSTTITFSGVSNSGTTTAVPINPASAGTLPGGYSLGAGYPAYEITTTATFTAPITICLQVPSVTNATAFAALRILHNEGGTLIDRTILSPDTPAPNFATKTICARVNSLSPFVVANNAPTAASVSVGGRVSESNGKGIARARVTLTDTSGETQTALTNQFGFYRFDDVAAGQTYIISAAHKRYQFINSPQVLNILEETSGVNFTGEPY